MSLSYAKACLIGALMESLAYGLYFCLFLQSSSILVKRISRGQINCSLFATNLLLFVLITLRMVLDNHAVVQAFTRNSSTPNAAEIYFTQFGKGSLWRTGTYVSLTLVADLFIVYRVYVVSSKHFLTTIVPAILSLGSIVSGALFLDGIHSLMVGTNPAIQDSTTMRELVFFVFTMLLNLVSTIIIALRVWLLQRKVAVNGLRQSLSGIHNSVSILVESSTLYTLTLLAVIIPAALESTVQYCLLSMLPGVVGISFSLILIRVARRTGSSRVICSPASLQTNPLNSIVSKDGNYMLDTVLFERSTQDYSSGQRTIQFEAIPEV